MLFPLYLNRVQFLVRSVVVSIMPGPFLAFSEIAGICAYLLTSVYWIAYVALPRASDVGLSRGLSVGLCLFPGVNLAFCFFLLFTKSDSDALPGEAHSPLARARNIPDDRRKMNQFILVHLIGLAIVAVFAFWPKEYARVMSPDGRHTAIAKYRAYQGWLPMSPGDAGGKEGWILIVAKDGEKIGAASVGRVSQVQDLRWTSDSVELPLVFGMALASTASASGP